MRHRELGALLLGAAVLWPRLASAQPAALPAIGYLHPGSLAGYEKRLAAFVEGFAQGGYVDGRNVAIEYRWGEVTTIDCPLWQPTWFIGRSL